MRLSLEDFGVDLVDIFGTEGTGGEPAIRDRYLQPLDQCIVTGRPRQAGCNRGTGQRWRADPVAS